MDIHFTTQIFKEGRIFVAHTPELDVSSCGGTKDRAARNLKEAVRLFLEEAAKMGTLDQILEEAGYPLRRARSRVGCFPWHEGRAANEGRTRTSPASDWSQPG